MVWSSAVSGDDGIHTGDGAVGRSTDGFKPTQRERKKRAFHNMHRGTRNNDNSTAEEDGFPARCFVPEMLVNYLLKKLHKEGIVQLQPASYFFHGVCLLVDISGFTKLSGEFCDQGKGGIDELQSATNGFMEQLVEVIYQFGGDIVKFAGDAIICVFSSELKIAVSRRLPSRELAAQTHSGEQVARFDPLCEFTTPIEVVLRAMHCAQTLRGVQTDKLSVHVAMSCGEMCFGILGGFENRWECLISGPCLHELSACLDDAPSKQAVIALSCAQVLQTHIPGMTLSQGKATHMIESHTYETEHGRYQLLLEPLPTGNQRVIGVNYSSNSQLFDSPTTVTPPLIVALLEASRALNGRGQHAAGANCALMEWEKVALQGVLMPFVPAPVLVGGEGSSLRAGLAEIRETTTMFMKWDSYDVHGKHRDLLQLQTCYLQAQAVLHLAGAFVRQFLVDDKGCVLIACWGVPHCSYLDNAHRALTSAAQIRHDLAGLGMQCSFGITTGDVYCGTVGSALHMEYAAIGSVVNMSARLMSKAHGGILLDEATHAWLSRPTAALLSAQEPIMVKGRDAPLPVFAYHTHAPILVVPDSAEIEDEEIKEEYKEVLLSVLDQLLRPKITQSSLSSHSVPSGKVSLLDFLAPRLTPHPSSRSVHARSPPPRSSLRKNAMPVVLIEGSEALGRTSIVGWLRKQAGKAQLPTLTVKCTRKDAALSYGVWTRLFAQLMPREVFQGDLTVQRRHIRALLKEVYPDEALVAETLAFPVMQSALNVTCSYAYEHGVAASDHRPPDITPPHHRKVTGRYTYSSLLSGRRRTQHSTLPVAVGVVTTTTSITSVLRAKPVAKPGKVETTPTLVHETLKRIFAHLLNWRTVVVVLENVHFADVESLQAMLELLQLPLRSTVVLTATTEPQDESVASAAHRRLSKTTPTSATAAAQHGHRRSAVAAKAMHWATQVRQQVATLPGTVQLILQEYTRTDMDRMLASALNVPVDQVPAAYSQLVLDFLGGSYYWMKEILLFIREHGPAEFLATIDDSEVCPRKSQEGSPALALTSLTALSSAAGSPGAKSELCPSFPSGFSSVQPLPAPAKFNALRFIPSSKSIATLVSHLSNLTMSTATLTPVPTPVPTPALRRAISRKAIRRGSVSGNVVKSVRRGGNSVRTGRERSTRTVAVRSSKNKFKLEQLVICRFEKLGAKMQQIFCTASIIDMTFSARVLYGVVPRQLKTHMTECVLSLLAQKWLFQDPDDEYQYHFAHPYLHGVIYELTPTRERNTVHQAIAEYVEETSAEDPEQFMLLAHHFQFCIKDKALRYAIQAVEYLIRTAKVGVLELEDILDLLSMALECCVTVHDFTVLRVVTDEAAQAAKAEVALKTQLQSTSFAASTVQPSAGWWSSWHCISSNAVHPDAHAPGTVPTQPRSGKGSGRYGADQVSGKQEATPLSLLLDEMIDFERRLVKKVEVQRYLDRGNLQTRHGVCPPQDGGKEAVTGGEEGTVCATVPVEPQPWQKPYLPAEPVKNSALSKLLRIERRTGSK